MKRSLALISLVLSGPSIAQGVVPPGAGGPIYRHPAKEIIAIFDRLCVSGPEDAAAQRDLASQSGFAPVVQPRGPVDMHYRSISFSLRDTAQGRVCSVGGLTDRAMAGTELGDLTKSLKPRISRVFALSANRQDPADTTQVVLRLLTPLTKSERTQ